MKEVWEREDYIERGLTSSEVEEHIASGKVNGEQTVRTKTVAQILWSNIFTFFNLVFAIMAIILAFFVEPNASGLGNFGFLGLVVINAGIGILQELRAKRTMDKLSLISAPKVKVIRSGEQTETTVEEVLLDDLTVLSAGDQICADAVIIEGNIEVNESLITGESDAVNKNVGDEVMSGSAVVSGKAKARVIHIGLDNFAMKISAGAKYFKKPNSAIWRALMLIVKVMAAIIVPLGIALFCVKYVVQGGDLNATVVNTIGTLVGMIPSGLAALSSAVFCISVIRLARHKTLAQDMYCVETLARVDVLCLDKTGTITTGEMEVHGVKPRRGLSEEDFKIIIKTLLDATQDENATAIALRNYVTGAESLGKAETVVPFSSARKWSGAYVGDRSYVLGAPEFVLDMTKPTTATVCEEMASKGYRVLAVASSPSKFKDNTLPKGIKAEGFIFITDTIRAEAPDTLKFFKEQGVEIKIISGDNPVTVQAVARRAGLENCDRILDMSTLAAGTDFTEIVDDYTVFGRVLPDQKLALIKALKAKGHTVAMTGDGVNDVLALKEADCSIAMASGSDAAKNVSSLVLLDSNFASMPRVVAEGRRSINNLERSASLFLVKTIYNFLLALMFMFIPSELPFAPQQLTLIGIVTIGVPSFILALEPNSERVTGRFLPKVLSSALPGALMVIAGIGGVLIAKRYFLPDLSAEQIQSMYVIVTTFVGFLYLFKVCLPFNVVHAVLYIFCVAFFVACYFIETPIFALREIFGLSHDFTKGMAQAMAIIAAIILPWFIVIFRLTTKLRFKVEKFLDERIFAGRREREEKKNEKRRLKEAQAELKRRENAINRLDAALAEQTESGLREEKEQSESKKVVSAETTIENANEPIDLATEKTAEEVDTGSEIPTTKQEESVADKADFDEKTEETKPVVKGTGGKKAKLKTAVQEEKITVKEEKIASESEEKEENPSLTGNEKKTEEKEKDEGTEGAKQEKKTPVKKPAAKKAPQVQRVTVRVLGGKSNERNVVKKAEKGDDGKEEKVQEAKPRKARSDKKESKTVKEPETNIVKAAKFPVEKIKKESSEPKKSENLES